MDRIDEIKMLIIEHEDSIRELKNEFNAIKDKERYYYIGVSKSGNYDYWDEYYYPLGKITEEQAMEWAGKDSDEIIDDEWGMEPYYFKVSDENYNKYILWEKTNRMASMLESFRYTRGADAEFVKQSNIFAKYFREKESEIAKDIGIRHLSFMHPREEQHLG